MGEIALYHPTQVVFEILFIGIWLAGAEAEYSRN